jgi:hypothetical protein
MPLYEVKYEVSGVIYAEDETDANSLAIKQFRHIANDDGGYQIKEVRPLPVKHNWRCDYIPYGMNPKGLVIDQIERILGFWEVA